MAEHHDEDEEPEGTPTPEGTSFQDVTAEVQDQLNNQDQDQQKSQQQNVESRSVEARKLEKLYNIDKFKFFDLVGYRPHPKQALFHKSQARFKIPICGRRFGKSQMAAKEFEPMLMI